MVVCSSAFEDVGDGRPSLSFLVFTPHERRIILRRLHQYRQRGRGERADLGGPDLARQEIRIQDIDPPFPTLRVRPARHLSLDVPPVRPTHLDRHAELLVLVRLPFPSLDAFAQSLGPAVDALIRVSAYE